MGRARSNHFQDAIAEQPSRGTRLNNLRTQQVQESALQEFKVRLKINLRYAQESDLPALEWWGWHREHREIIRSVFEETLCGDSLMIVADSGGFPIGQAWLDLKQGRDSNTGMLWAVRVIPGFQAAGIGSRLIEAAEQILFELGYETCEISVEEENESARRLYERMGYREFGKRREERKYFDPSGCEQCLVTDEWILQKALV
jgi:ribosomal protein S18 acetylase RimI-like enzyme